jgi:hypothetical protein
MQPQAQYGVRRVLAAFLYYNEKRRGLAALHTLRDFGNERYKHH